MTQREPPPQINTEPIIEQFALVLRQTGWIDGGTEADILESQTLAEAVAIADRAGVVLTEVPMWKFLWEPRLEMEQESGDVRATSLDRRTPGEGVAQIQANRIAESVQIGETVKAAVEQNIPIMDALTQTGVITGEDEEPMSSLIFPEGFGSGINDAAHIKMVTSDDYSPWGPDQSREEMAQHMDTMIFKDIVDSRGREHREGREYWKNQYRQPGGYVAGQEVLTWAGMSTRTRMRLEDKWVDAGLLDPDGGYVPGSMGMPQLQAMRASMGVANLIGVGYETATNTMVRDFQAFQRAEARRAARRGGGGGGRASFTVPASLREIPDYESLAQDARNRFRQRLGRDPEEWEEAILADHLGARHRESNAERIKAARAAFYAAQGGGQGVMEVEVPNPELRNQRFIEERYGPEIDRQERIEDQAVTNKLMIDAITRGTQMVGG